MSLSITSPSSNTASSLLSSLGVSSSTRAISTDLNSYTQAQGSGNTSAADAAIVQLKADLATEQASLLSSLFSAAGDTSSSGTDVGDQLLSNVFNTNSNSTALSEVQQLSAQSGQSSSALSTSTASSTSGSQIDVTV